MDRQDTEVVTDGKKLSEHVKNAQGRSLIAGPEQNRKIVDRIGIRDREIRRRKELSDHLEIMERLMKCSNTVKGISAQLSNALNRLRNKPAGGEKTLGGTRRVIKATSAEVLVLRKFDHPRFDRIAFGNVIELGLDEVAYPISPEQADGTGDGIPEELLTAVCGRK
jgi:hypothetical protein